jgi:hypothetical protein
MDWIERHTNETDHNETDDKGAVVALGDEHDRGVESLCVGEAA